MTNDELKEAIETAARWIRSTSETEVQHYRWRRHLDDLLDEQKKRAQA